jgi:glycosyltransferase involved in cell wall biosynthesis
MSDVLIVIPARNEARNLADVLSELRAVRQEDSVLVVDDGSTDRTAEVARQAGCDVLRLPFHLGYGAAVQAGIKLGLRRGFPIVVTFDGDGQHDPADLAPLVQAVREGRDLVLGSRFLGSPSWRGGFARRTGSALFALMAWALTGLRLTDPTSGLKALGPRAQGLFAASRFPDRFPDADALVLARRSRLQVAERPARMRRSRNRHSMHDGHRAVAYTFNMLFSLLVAAVGREGDLRG